MSAQPARSSIALACLILALGATGTVTAADDTRLVAVHLASGSSSILHPLRVSAACGGSVCDRQSVFSCPAKLPTLAPRGKRVEFTFTGRLENVSLFWTKAGSVPRRQVIIREGRHVSWAPAPGAGDVILLVRYANGEKVFTYAFCST